MFWIILLVGVLLVLVLRKITPAQTNPSPDMSRKQAADILGVTEDADAGAIRHAHKELMKKLHPDQGGSSYLGQQINQARDRLLHR